VYVGAAETWERVAERRTNEEIESLLKAIETGEPPAEVAHLRPSVERWRAAKVAETRRTAKDKAYERVVGEMRRDALAAMGAKGPAFRPVQWEESDRVFRVQGEWTVTVSVTGTDHTAVREAFAAGMPGRRDEILADAQKRIPRLSRTVKASSDTPGEGAQGLAAGPLQGHCAEACHRRLLARQLGDMAAPRDRRDVHGHRHQVAVRRADRHHPPHCDPLGRQRAGRDRVGHGSEAD
jgi:hypothetical protein